MNPLHSPEGWLLLAEMNGKPVCVNLWEAIEAGMLLVQVNPLARIRIQDVAGDVPEHREGREVLRLPKFNP